MNRHTQSHDSQSPPSGQPVIGRKGLTIPWAWITSVLPIGGLGGAVLHSQLFGAPPEFGRRLEKTEASIIELHETMALERQSQQQLTDELKHIRAILESINHRVP